MPDISLWEQWGLPGVVCGVVLLAAVAIVRWLIKEHIPAMRSDWQAMLATQEERHRRERAEQAGTHIQNVAKIVGALDALTAEVKLHGIQLRDLAENVRDLDEHVRTRLPTKRSATVLPARRNPIGEDMED